MLMIATIWPSSPAIAEEIIVPLSGEFKKINTDSMNEAIKKLKSSDKAVRTKAVAEIKEHADKYPPPVFYLLSNVLFNEGDKDDAAFWFYAGQLRGRYDANRCADVSARSGIGVLNMEFGGPINRYMFMQSDLSKIEKLIPKVVEWDKVTAHNYDQRWINLHGMDAMITSLDGQAKEPTFSLPEKDWEAIAEKTRAEYLSGFADALKDLQAAKKGQPGQEKSH